MEKMQMSWQFARHGRTQRRKVLATDAYNKLKNIFESKKASLGIKIRIFKSHIESIFMITWNFGQPQRIYKTH